jgi:hypothetical protein
VANRTKKENPKRVKFEIESNINYVSTVVQFHCTCTVAATVTLGVLQYQCKAWLWWQASRQHDLNSGPFWPARADRDPDLPAKDVTKQRKVPRRWKTGGWSHSPLISVFILLFIVPSQEFRLGGSVLTRTLATASATLHSRLLCLHGFPPHHILK